MVTKELLEVLGLFSGTGIIVKTKSVKGLSSCSHGDGRSRSGSGSSVWVCACLNDLRLDKRLDSHKHTSGIANGGKEGSSSFLLGFFRRHDTLSDADSRRRRQP